MVQRQIGDHGRVTSMLSEMSELVYGMINCEKPIVSAINGAAVGAGLVVALLADISVCAEDCPARRRPRPGSAWRPATTRRSSGRCCAGWPGPGTTCSPARWSPAPRQNGSAWSARALPREHVLEESLRVAHGLATGPQLAIRLTKRALNGWLRAAGPIFEQSAAYEMLTFMGEDVKEGAAALIDKRPPVFG